MEFFATIGLIMLAVYAIAMLIESFSAILEYIDQKELDWVFIAIPIGILMVLDYIY